MTSPLVILHEQTGQPESCMRGLAEYANRVARSPLTARFENAPSMRDWLWRQPIKLDAGDGREVERGCIPYQRSRLWPKDGMNCWESTAHWLGWHLRNHSPIEAHLYDSRINGQRHVFPAARELGEYEDPPTLIVLQPPVQSPTQRLRMQSQVRAFAQALGPLPPPLQLIRRKEFWPWDNVADFVVEMGGIQSAEHTGPLPESALATLPPFWRQQRVRQWPTANGDLLFLILEKDWVPSLQDLAIGIATGGISFAATRGGGGHGFANVLRIPGGALTGGSTASGRSVIAGAPPANGWNDTSRSGCGGPAPAQAWYNDLLGGAHWVGDKVLRAFGQGNLSDTLAGAEGNELPDWARTDEQRKTHEAEVAKRLQEEQETDRKHLLEEQKQHEAELAKHLQEEQKRHEAELARLRSEEHHAPIPARPSAAQVLRAQISAADQTRREALDRIAEEYLQQP